MSNICISNSDMEPISSYYQWDIDQVIIISGLKVSGSITVHFCNVNSKNSIVVTPTVAGDVISVKVPNILLQNPEAIIIYVHRTDASTGSRTIYMSRIAVVPKAKPDDYIYTETEVLQYSALDERICALEKSTGIGGGIHIGPYPPDDPNVDIWLDTSEEETPPYIPNTINAKPGQIVRVVTVDENGAIVAVEAVDMPSGGESYELPAATADTLGGVKAEPATEEDTQPVRIGEDGMLFTAPGAGSPGNPGAMAQILGMIGDLKKLNTEDKSSLVAAINEVLRKGNYVKTVNGAAPDENGNVELPVYDGAFSVTPSADNDLMLLTAQTFMDSDIKVEKIPYAEVTNHSGGTTATIGG